MEALDLRIGNILNWQIGKSILQGKVTSISTATIVIDHKSNFKTTSEHDTYRLIPVPLTEEWLLKFGFKYQDRDVSHGNGKIERFWSKHWFTGGDNWWLEINLNPITKKSNGFFWLNWNIGGGNNFVHLPHSCELKYVHQLQNLYYALTGEELTLKDK